MKSLARVLAAFCLAASSVCAQAGDLKVSANATFNLPDGSVIPIIMQFTLPQDVVGAVPQGGEAFAVADLPVLYTFNGQPTITFSNTQLSWFAYASENYYGFDLRLFDFGAPGERLQFVWTTNASLYTGDPATPTLLATSLSGLFTTVNYYLPDGSVPFTDATSAGSYEATLAVPEPATALLLSLGLGVLMWRRRRAD